MILNSINLKKLLNEFEKMYGKSEGITIGHQWSSYVFVKEHRKILELEPQEHGELLTIHPKHSNVEYTKVLVEKFVAILKEKNVETMICFKGQKEPFIPIGPNAEKVYEMIKLFKKRNAYADGFEVKYEYLPELYILSKVRHTPRLEVYLDDDVLFEELTSVEETKKMIKKYEEEEKSFELFRNEMLDMANRYDPTCYLYGTDGIYLFNEEYDFSMGKMFENNELSYFIYSMDDEVKGEDWEKVKKEFREKFESFLKKERIQAAIEGKAFDLVPKLWNLTYGSHASKVGYETNLNKKEINEMLKKAFETKEVEEMDAQTVKECHLFLNKKYQINKGFIVGELCLFSSPKKFFLYKKENIKEKNLA